MFLIIAFTFGSYETDLVQWWKFLGWKRVEVHDARQKSARATIAELTRLASGLNIAVGFKPKFWNGSEFGDRACHQPYVRKTGRNYLYV